MANGVNIAMGRLTAMFVFQLVAESLVDAKNSLPTVADDNAMTLNLVDHVLVITVCRTRAI